MAEEIALLKVGQILSKTSRHPFMALGSISICGVDLFSRQDDKGVRQNAAKQSFLFIWFKLYNLSYSFSSWRVELLNREINNYWANE